LLTALEREISPVVFLASSASRLYKSAYTQILRRWMQSIVVRQQGEHVNDYK